MKLFFFFTLITFQAFGSENCIPNKEKIKNCSQFTKNVLEKAIFEDPAASKNESPSTFVKDEKEAVTFLNLYDPTKLALAEQKCLFSNIRFECKTLEASKRPLGCENSMGVFNYFRGLIKGMKVNDWNHKTIFLGEEVIKKHVDYVLSSNPSLLDTVIVFAIIADAQANGFVKGIYKDAHIFQIDAEKISKDLHQAQEKNSKASLSCQQKNALHKKAEQDIVELIKKWKS